MSYFQLLLSDEEMDSRSSPHTDLENSDSQTKSDDYEADYDTDGMEDLMANWVKLIETVIVCSVPLNPATNVSCSSNLALPCLTKQLELFSHVTIDVSHFRRLVHLFSIKLCIWLSLTESGSADARPVTKSNRSNRHTLPEVASDIWLVIANLLSSKSQHLSDKSQLDLLLRLKSQIESAKIWSHSKQKVVSVENSVRRSSKSS